MQIQGIESLEDLADARHALAIHGRYGDTTIGHLTPGEMVLPRPIADDPVLKRQLFDAFERHELNPYQYQVGHFENSINPLTGVPEFGFFKKIGKFLKKAAPVIGQVVGFAIGGPAGAAIGGGIGGAVKEGDVKGAVKGAAQGYIGGNIAQGMGLSGGKGIGSLIPGQNSMYTFGANPTQAKGIGALFQNVGANLGDMIAPGQTAPGTVIPKIGDTFDKLSTFQKMGTAGLGLAALGGFEPGEDESRMPDPSGQLGGYLQAPLRPATIPQQYQSAGSSVSAMNPYVATTRPSLGTTGSTAQQLEDAMRRNKDYSELLFPQFQRVNVKNGGRIQDGSEIPELDLRKTGGGVSDSSGSGDEDTIPAMLADGEFVMTKQAVKGMGNGNHSDGIRTLYNMMAMNEDKAAMMGLGRA